MMKTNTPTAPTRCPWCLGDPEYIAYHDREWGTPLRDSQTLFEFLVLDGAQAGLSWLTILKRRPGYRAAFDGFDPWKMAAYTDADRARLLADPRVIRNRLKIASAIGNARAYCALTEKRGSFSTWLWDFVDGRPIVNHWKTSAEVPASTPLSERISRELKALGFSFVGPTIVYAFIQAAGLVNDHLVDCFRHDECAR